MKKDDDNIYHIQRNFVIGTIEVGIPSTSLTGTLGYDYYAKQKYYNWYNGPTTVDEEVSKGPNGNLKLTPFKPKEFSPTLFNKPSATIGVNVEKKFYGLDLSAGIKLLFGIKIQMKIGLQEK